MFLLFIVFINSGVGITSQELGLLVNAKNNHLGGTNLYHTYHSYCRILCSESIGANSFRFDPSEHCVTL